MAFFTLPPILASVTSPNYKPGNCVCVWEGKGGKSCSELGDLLLDMKGSKKGEEERLTSGPLSAGSLVAAGSDGGVTWLSPTG